MSKTVNAMNRLTVWLWNGIALLVIGLIAAGCARVEPDKRYDLLDNFVHYHGKYADHKQESIIGMSEPGR